MNPYPPPPDWAAAFTSVGVTGTNGKSSTTRYLAAAMAAVAPTARVTTVGASLLGLPSSAGAGRAADEESPPPKTHRAFLAHLARLREHTSDTGPGPFAAIEATSATLAIGFARAWPFRAGVFTNLGHDHLAAHGSYEHYLASKAQLFLALPPGSSAVLNAGDPNSSLIAEVLPASVRALWFAGPGQALDRAVDLRIVRARHHWSGLELELESAMATASGPPLPSSLKLRALPEIQAHNAAAALLAALAIGLPAGPSAAAIARCRPPRGRFELLRPSPAAPARPRVVVDYAHSPEALETTLQSARSLCQGRLTLVFGAGGGSADPSKREPLGRTAALADRVVLTSDNPRDEDPADIAAQVRAGLPSNHDCHVELDRGRAIAGAIEAAGPEDLVLIAGKGHERTQVHRGETRPFSDHDAALAALVP